MLLKSWIEDPFVWLIKLRLHQEKEILCVFTCNGNCSKNLKMQSKINEIIRTTDTSQQTTLIMINMPNKWTLKIASRCILLCVVRSEIHLLSLCVCMRCVFFSSSFVFLSIADATTEFHCAVRCSRIGVTCFSLMVLLITTIVFVVFSLHSLSTSIQFIFLLNDTHARTHAQ